MANPSMPSASSSRRRGIPDRGSKRLIVGVAAAVIVTIVVATVVIVIALRPSTYKIRFSAMATRPSSSASMTWGIGDNLRSVNTTGSTQWLNYTDDGSYEFATLTVSDPGSTAEITCSITQEAPWPFWEDPKTIAFQRGTGEVTCAAPLGANTP